MATAPSPFFYSPPSAYPSASAYPPPAYGFSPAPPFGYSNFPSAAAAPAYAPYSPPPAVPYAATYPYPPPSSAYTPAPSFSPNWPTWPPPAPESTTSTAPSTFSSATTSSLAQPTTSSVPPASGTLSMVNASSSHLSLMQDDAMVQAAVDERVPAKDAIDTIQGQLAKLISISSQLAVAMGRQTTKMRVTESPPKTFRRRPPITPHPSPRSEESSALEIPVETPLFALPVADDPVLTEMEPVPYASIAQQNPSSASSDASTRDLSSGATSGFTSSAQHAAEDKVHIQNQLQKREHYLQSIQGEVASLSERVVQLVSMQHIHDGEIASQASGFGIQLETQSSELPECYGLENLNRHSLFRADGNERSSYGLPENYLLDRATLGPVFDAYDDDLDGCSTEFVDAFLGTPKQQKSDQFANCFCEALNAFSEDTLERVSHAYNVDTEGHTDELVYVFASPPEQQPYEAKQQDSEQLLKCIGKATENEQTTACLNYISDVFGFTSELQEQDDERAGNCSVLKASNSFVSRSSLLSIEHSMRERRLLWDPGASASLHSSKDSDIKILWQDISSMLALPLEIGRKLQWDPGDTNFLQSLCATTAVQVRDCMHYIASTGINPMLHATVFIMQSDAHLSQEVNVQQLRDPSLKLLVTHESRKEYADTVGFLNGQCKYIHQRGVQENHNAKQLLISSKNCLHIWKVDILFTTFLPP